MKKQFLLLTGLFLLSGLGINAQEQERSKDDPLWTMGFESGMDMFNPEEEASIADSIVNLEYYMGMTSSQESGTGTTRVDTFETATIDTTIILQHNIDPIAKHATWGSVDASYTDTATVVKFAEKDPTGLDDLSGLGVDVTDNTYYFRWAAQKKRQDAVEYSANLFVRGLPIKPRTSYRLNFYMKADTTSAQVDVRLMRGWYESEKSFTTDPKNESSAAFIGLVKGTDWIDELTEQPDPKKLNHWQRYTFMYYYENDSIQNALAHNFYYWGGLWDGVNNESKRWSYIFEKRKDVSNLTPDEIKGFTKQMEITDEETGEKKTIDTVWASRIVQPNTFFLRFGFIGNSAVYNVDEISLFESNIGAAEYSNDIIRLNFGYQTNIPDLCKTSELGRIALEDEDGNPLDAFQLLVKKKGVIADKFNIIHIEYQSDGMVYLWLDEMINRADGYEFWLSFKNPEDERFQVKYTNQLRPYAFDEDNEIVPDFTEEKLAFSTFEAVPSLFDVPPTVKSAEPVATSFNLGEANKVFKFKFTREVYDQAAGIPAGEKFGIRLVDRNSAENIIYLNDYKSAFDASDSSITVTIPAGVTIPNGIYDMEFMYLRAIDEGTPSSFTYETNNKEPFKLEYTWGGDFKENKKTTEGSCYMKLKDSYDAAYKYAYDETLLETKALVNFKTFLADYVPDNFFAVHTNPADYDVAKKAVDDELAKLKSAMEIAGKLQDALKLAKKRLDYMGQFSKIAALEKYTALDNLYKEFNGKDYSTIDADEILADYNSLFAAIVALEGATDKMLQANELYELCKKLNVEFTEGNAEYIELGIGVAAYNELLIEKLKLEATRAIYKTLNEGKDIDSIDVSGFIDNPSFYTSGMLDVDMEKYDATYHTSTAAAYRIKLNQDIATVFPGWTINTSITKSAWGSGMNPYGVWNDPRDGWFEDIKGVLVENPGDIAAGAIGADWGSGFTLKQEIADLPEGVYTLLMPVEMDGSATPADKIIIGTDTLASSACDSAKITMSEPLVAGDTLHIEYYHSKTVPGKDWSGKPADVDLQMGFFMNNSNLFLKVASKGAGAYAAELDAIEQKIVTGIDDVELNDDMIIYNMNGVRVNALGKNEMGIGVNRAGKALKFMNNK